MPLRASLLLVVAGVLASACERYDWPPFEDRLTNFFDENRASLERLEREMVSDGFARMNARILSGSLSHPAVPALDPDQIDKYRSLVRRGDTELSAVRRAGAIEFELLTQPVDTSLYLFRFVHGDQAEERDDCDASMRVLPCGRCAIELARGWRLEYEWFPQNLDVEAKECRQ